MIPSDFELDRVMTLEWPGLLRAAMARPCDPAARGFIRSISRQAKKPDWRPTVRQWAWMRALLEEHRRGSLAEDFDPIEQGDA